ADQGDRYNGRAADPHQHVRQRLQARGAGWDTGRVLKLREEIVVRDEEALDRAVEHHDLDLIVGFDLRDNLIQWRNAFRAEDVEGRVVEDNSPIGRRASFETDAFRVIWAVHAHSPPETVEVAWWWTTDIGRFGTAPTGGSIRRPAGPSR